MPFKSSVDSWAIIDVVWDEVMAESGERTVPSEHSLPREGTGQDAAQANQRSMEEGRE